MPAADVVPQMPSQVMLLTVLQENNEPSTMLLQHLSDKQHVISHLDKYDNCILYLEFSYFFTMINIFWSFFSSTYWSKCPLQSQYKTLN